MHEQIEVQTDSPDGQSQQGAGNRANIEAGSRQHTRRSKVIQRLLASVKGLSVDKLDNEGAIYDGNRDWMNEDRDLRHE